MNDQMNGFTPQQPVVPEQPMMPAQPVGPEVAPMMQPVMPQEMQQGVQPQMPAQPVMPQEMQQGVMQPQMPGQPMMPQGMQQGVQPQMPGQPVMPQGIQQPMMQPQMPGQPMMPQGMQQPMMQQMPGQPMMPQGMQQPMMQQMPGQPMMQQMPGQPMMNNTQAPKKNKTTIIIIAVVAVLAIVGVVLFLTLSGGKKLTCSINEFGSEGEITLKFKNDKVVSGTGKMTYDLGELCDLYDEDDFAEIEESLKEDSGDENAIVKRNGCVIEVTASASKEELEDWEDMTYEEIKSEIEDMGGVCK